MAVAVQERPSPYRYRDSFLHPVPDLEVEEERAQVKLWVTDKWNRLLEMQTDIEKIIAFESDLLWAMEVLWEEMERLPVGSPKWKIMRAKRDKLSRRWMKLNDLKHRILRNVEESTGQLPTRCPNPNNVTKWNVEIRSLPAPVPIVVPAHVDEPEPVFVPEAPAPEPERAPVFAASAVPSNGELGPTQGFVRGAVVTQPLD